LSKSGYFHLTKTVCLFHVNSYIKEGGEVIYLKTNVVSSEDMQELARFALKRYGRIDVLVNNAGIMPHSQLNELKVHEWEQMIDINIKGVLYGIAAVLPTMREQKSDRNKRVASLNVTF
jgi:NADP-dependent 3-hydroxy acid dehydrogenase YdfG